MKELEKKYNHAEVEKEKYDKWRKYFECNKENNKWYWFENSFESSRGIHEFSSIKDALDCVKEKQLEYAINIGIAKKEDKDFIKSHEYSKLEKPFSVDEYLNHVMFNN